MRHHITLEIPASRKAFWDWYEADRNKALIYYLALIAWCTLFLQAFTILPLTAMSNYRVAFYLPLSIFMVLLPLATHWLIQCALNDYDISHKRIEANDSDSPEIEIT